MPLYQNAYLGQDWDNGTIKAALVSEDYTPSLAHDFYDDVNSYLCTGTNATPATLANASRTTSGSVTQMTADDLSWTSVTTTGLAWIVLFDDSGTASTSPVIGYLDARDGGSARDLTNADIDVEWSDGGVLVARYE